MQQLLDTKLFAFIITILFCTAIISCVSKGDIEDLTIYLWDYRDCANCKPKEIFIEDDKVYSLNKGFLFSRILEKNEIDTLSVLISNINYNQIDSTNYSHLAHYEFIADFSVSSSRMNFSTSVYDSVFPRDISETRKYLLDIIERKGLTKVEKRPPQIFEDIWIHRLVSNNMDTLLPSRESMFKIQKVLMDTNQSDWIKTDSIGKEKYKIVFEKIGEKSKDIESMGITVNGKLFYKLSNDKEYFFTPFLYGIQEYPKFNPEL